MRCVVLALLLARTTAIAVPPGQSGAPPAQYEAYVLALEWQPTWSLDACPSGKQENAALIRHFEAAEGAFARTHLSLHGLWPNYTPSMHQGYQWPQFCNVSGVDFPACEAHPQLAQCQPSQAAVAAFNVSARWQQWTLQYAWGELASHEWGKHGSCTPWSANVTEQLHYWEWQERAFKAASAGRGPQLVSASVGRNISYRALNAAFVADMGGAQVSLVCAEGCRLEQAWLSYEAAPSTLEPLVTPAHAVNMSGAGTCATCEAVHIPEWLGCPTAPPPTPPATTCAHDQHGPPCTSDAQCLHVSGCVRCAHSGFCTDLPAIPCA